MIILAFLVPLLLGVFVWRLLPAKSEGAGLLGNVFLAWGVGVGVASQIALYVTLASGRCIPAVIVLTGVGMMGLFWWLSRRGQVARHGYSAVSLVQALFVILAMWLLLFLAIHLPAGGYDAWSLWNYRAASIFIGWDGWTGVFHNQVQGKHPWLVPFFTVWGWSFAGQGTFWLPLLTAVFMATATVGLLVFAVGEERGLWWALLAGLLLLSVPFFTWHAVSQYASIFVAYYALAAVISFRRADSDNWTGWFILCGIFLGFLASSKDEGIVLACLCLIASWVTGAGRAVLCKRSFWLALLAALSGMLICEVLMRGGLVRAPLVTSLNQHLDWTNLFDAGRWRALASFFWWRILRHAEFGRMWIWLPFILLGVSDRFVRFILFVLTGYGLIFAVLYVMAADPIVWRMGVSLNRVMFHVVPVIVFGVFVAFAGFASGKGKLFRQNLPEAEYRQPEY